MKNVRTTRDLLLRYIRISFFAISMEPKNADYHAEKAYLYRMASNNEDALKEINIAIAASPKNEYGVVWICLDYEIVF